MPHQTKPRQAGPTHRDLWADGLGEAAQHTATSVPLWSALMGVTAATLLEHWGPGSGSLALALQAAAAILGFTALLNVLRHVNETRRYTKGLRERPHYLRPNRTQKAHLLNAAKPDGLRVLPDNTRTWICSVCSRRTTRVMELKHSTPKGSSYRRFALCHDCHDTPEAAARVAAERRMAATPPSRMTPANELARTMAEARSRHPAQPE